MYNMISEENMAQEYNSKDIPDRGVVLKNIQKIFDEKTVVLKDINLEIKDKEFLILVGPSGCGKSTLLRIIAGLEYATKGDIFINKTWMNRIPPKDRNIAFVFQSYALYPHMNVFDNISFSLRLKKENRKLIREKVEKASEILGITDQLLKKPAQLSGGQRQRVALGRAIVRDPDVFLLDEPLSNLDAKLRSDMRSELIRLQRQLQVTMIYVTHDQVEAMTMGDRIVVLYDGEIQQIGSPIDLYERPNNKFVSGFIGTPTMNYLDAILLADSNQLQTSIGNITITSSEKELLLNQGTNKQFIIGIRPEEISIASQTEEGFSGVIDVLEPLGALTHLYVVFPSLNEGDNIRLTLTVNGLFNLDKEGKDVKVRFNKSRIHIFDKTTELTLKHGLA